MECQQHEKHLLDGAGSRTPWKEQGRLERRAKSRRFDEYLHSSLPWGIVPVTRVHLYFQREKFRTCEVLPLLSTRSTDATRFWRTERQRDANRR